MMPVFLSPDDSCDDDTLSPAIRPRLADAAARASSYEVSIKKPVDIKDYVHIRFL